MGEQGQRVVEASLPGALPAAFLDVAAQVFADDPRWIPEVPAAVTAAFSEANPWFGRGRARAFVVPGAARAAAFFDPDLRIDGRPVAYFGYWVSGGDAAADRALFDAVESWARAEGATDLYGPIDFTTYGDYRVLLSMREGATPFPGEPYDPPGAADRLEACGFTLHTGYRSRYVPRAVAHALAEAHGAQVEALEQEGFRFERVDPATWDDRLGELYGMVDAVFGANFGYAAIPESAFRGAVGQSFIRRACRRTSVLAFAPDGRLAAFDICFPHWGPLVRQGAGAARIPVSDLDWAEHFDRLADHGPVGLIVKTIGVSPAFRRKGLMNALFTLTVTRSEGRYDYWVGATMRDDNFSRRYAPESCDDNLYGLYYKRISEDA